MSGLWDPGAQPERTYQAWTRTGLALTACALLCTRLAPPAGLLAVLAGLLGAATAWGVVVRQKRRLHSGEVSAAPRAVLTMAALAVLLAVTGVVLLALPALRH